MKKLIALIISFSIILSCFGFPIHAANDANDTVSDEEIFELRACIRNHGFSAEQLVASVLYDDNDNPAYIFAASEDGYAILDRGTFRFNECGGGNPYKDYMECVKYYGGPLCYYVKAADAALQPDAPENKYFDIRTQEFSDVIPQVLRSTENEDESDIGSPAKKGTESYFLHNNYSGIRRKAYGFNNDDTCSAVATGIALNYIAKEYNMAVVPKEYISPYLDKGTPTSESALSSMYPEAKKLHRFLTGSCNMGPVSYASTIQRSLRYYIDQCVTRALGFNDHYSYNFDLVYTMLPNSTTIKNNIKAGKPVLITTTIGTPNQDHNFHTMCVYGWRNTYGKDEILVHSGWYSDLIDDNTCPPYSKQQDIFWLDESYATYGYYFSFENPLGQYDDIPVYTNWAYKGILYVVHRNIMNGTDQSHFRPSEHMTRAMFATVLYRMAGSPSASGLNNPYSDISSSSYCYNAVRWLTARGIVDGTSPGVFSPNSQITREQLAVMLYRYANYEGRDISARANLSRFPDQSSVSNYALDAMRWAVAKGYIAGVQIGSVDYLAPQNKTTRAQVATIIERYCND